LNEEKYKNSEEREMRKKEKKKAQTHSKHSLEVEARVGTAALRTRRNKECFLFHSQVK
jgi:hypothetical protein